MKEWCAICYQTYCRKTILRLVTKYKISANTITIFDHIFVLTFGAYFFSRGTWICNILGLLVMIISGVLDYADGDVAKTNKKVTPMGVWLDTVFDQIIQVSIMAAIAIGCHKNGLSFTVSAFYFVGNTGSNMVSYYYNNTFGFESASGSELFRKYMDMHPNWFNRMAKNLIDPTSSPVGLVLYTVRYWVAIGAILNGMNYVFVFITIVLNIKWLIMYVLFALHLQEYKKLWVLQALAILDKERKEHYEL